MLHMRLKDAAAELNVPITYLRRLCRQNGFPTWPGKRVRLIHA
jgi:predicted secreted protein